VNPVDINVNISNHFDISNIFALFGGMNDSTEIIFDDIRMVSQYGLIKVTPEYWQGKNYSRLPIQEGRQLTSDDLSEKRKVALIGKRLFSHTHLVNGERFISLDNEEYKIIGILGIEGKNVDPIDGQIIMPATALSNRSESMIKENSLVRLIIHNSTQIYNDVNKIKSNASIIDGISVQVLEGGGETGPSNSTVRIGDEVYLSIIIYILSIINAINISIFWVNDRKYEIGIKKAFGYSNFDIFYMLYSEMCVLVALSVLAGFAISISLQDLLTRWIDYPFSFSLHQILISIIFIFLTSAITVFIPSIKALKISPVDAMKHS